jgi:hypothetical protein
MPITEQNADESYGSIPSVDVDTAGRGRKPIEGTGISQVLSIPMDQADVPQSRTNVPSYQPDEPWKP